MKYLIPLLLALSFLSHAQSQSVETVPLQKVSLLPSPFKHAQDTNLNYLLELDADRLLAPYRQQAGIESPEPSYGNWEGDGLGGHIGGHYLSGLALTYAATGNEEIHQRLQYMLNSLAEVQKANGNGYLGGIPGGEAMWEEIQAGNIDADLFVLNDKWVPWYNLDKVYAGLGDVYRYTDNEKALQMLLALTDWTIELVSELSDEQIQQMLVSEHGGLNIVFADVYEITGEEKYLHLARQFSHQQILQPLSQHKDQLDGLHANTQIPKVVGFERVHGVAGDEAYGEAAEYFWRNVVKKRTVAIGGNSVREHFHDSDDFSDMIEDVEGPETCNSYNMLKLSRLLYQRGAETRYIDYYERTLYNHILSSQHPQSGGLVYFTPMRPNHYRVYSAVHDAMWCCVGSGIESHAKYGRMIYASDEQSLYVNLFIPSRLQWQERGLDLTMSTRFPDDDSVSITINQKTDVALKLRYPRWVEADQLSLSVNGEAQEVSASPGEYISIQRNWERGDKVELRLPMQLSLEQMPDKSDYYAVLFGPIVLAAKTDPMPGEQLNFVADDSRMGHIAQGEQCPLESVPMFVADSPDFLDKIKPVPGEPLTFEVKDLVQPAQNGSTRLIPFFRLHDSRYMLYWPYSPEEKVDQFRAAQSSLSEERQQLEELTVDSLIPGEQQPEADHYFKGEDTQAGVNNGDHWRDASGWFSYEMKNPEGQARVLRLTYFGGDSGRRFDVLVNGERLTSVHLKGEQGAKLFSREYELPDKLHDESTLTVRFEAHEGSIAGGIYGVRLLKHAVD